MIEESLSERRRRKKEKEKDRERETWKDPLMFSNPIWMLAGIAVGIILTKMLSSNK